MLVFVAKDECLFQWISKWFISVLCNCVRWCVDIHVVGYCNWIQFCVGVGVCVGVCVRVCVKFPYLFEAALGSSQPVHKKAESLRKQETNTVVSANLM